MIFCARATRGLRRMGRVAREPPVLAQHTGLVYLVDLSFRSIWFFWISF